MVWPAIIAAASSVAGGLMSKDAQSNANDQAADQAANNLAKQEEFARQGITWRSRDIMNAYRETGIHPLALLGVQGPSYSPVSAAFTPESGLGDAISKGGQDISRAMMASADTDKRVAAMAPLMNIQVEGAQLDNDIKRMHIASLAQRLQQNSMPPMPINPGAGVNNMGQSAIMDTPFIKLKPNEVTPQRIPGVEPGIQPDAGVVQTPDGRRVIVPGKEFHDRSEDMPMTGWQWWFRNNPGLMSNRKARDAILGNPGAGYDWKLNILTGEWGRVRVTDESYNPGGQRGRVNWLNRWR